MLRPRCYPHKVGRLQIHKASIKWLLDRQGMRWLITGPGSVYLSLLRRQLARIRYDDGWIFHFPDGVLPWYDLSVPTLHDVEARSKDAFQFHYRVRPGDTVLDIGAGVGEDTLWFSRSVGPSGRVIAVEAHPSTCALLEKTRQLNHLGNTVVVQAAIADREGRSMITDAEGTMESSIVRGAATGRPVRLMTIDQLAAEKGIDRIDLLKMNIEGAESLAIQGMKRTIRRTRHVVISCHDFLATTGFDDPMRTKSIVSDFLRSHGFHITGREDDRRPWIRDTLYGTNVDSQERV
jgi:FkbM family methyltransferase